VYEIVFEIDLPDFDVAQRQLDRLHRDAGKAALEWFIKERLPKRFDGSLKGSLAFEERDPRYEKRKARRGLKGVPHRWTGRTRSRAREAQARVTKQRLTVVIDGLNRGYSRGAAMRGTQGRRTAKYVHVRAGKQPGGGTAWRKTVREQVSLNRPDLYAEIRRLLQAEVDVMAEIYQQHYVKGLMELLSKNKIRQRIAA